MSTRTIRMMFPTSLGHELAARLDLPSGTVRVHALFAHCFTCTPMAVSVKEQEEEVAEQLAEEADTQEVVSDAAAQAIVQTPVALLGALLTTPGGATSALSVARLLGRNFPLVLLLVMIGALFWPTDEATPPDDEVDARRPNGADDHMPSALHH